MSWYSHLYLVAPIDVPKQREKKREEEKIHSKYKELTHTYTQIKFHDNRMLHQSKRRSEMGKNTSDKWLKAIWLTVIIVHLEWSRTTNYFIAVRVSEWMLYAVYSNSSQLRCDVHAGIMYNLLNMRENKIFQRSLQFDAAFSYNFFLPWSMIHSFCFAYMDIVLNRANLKSEEINKLHSLVSWFFFHSILSYT